MEKGNLQTLADWQTLFRNRLGKLYDQREAVVITSLVLQNLLHCKSFELPLRQGERLSTAQKNSLEAILIRLLKEEPVQYILGEAEFFGLALKVNRHTLIPRPETEELADWLLKTHGQEREPLQILDIGTGSGCIAIALKKYAPQHRITALDVSKEALTIAAQNANRHDLEVRFLELDILREASWTDITAPDIIVSNPPYIPEKDRKNIQKNVKDFEPHRALFVADAQPLVFYETIALLGKHKLREKGWLYFELNPDYADQTAAMMERSGYGFVEMKQDINGKKRLLRGRV